MFHLLNGRLFCNNVKLNAICLKDLTGDEQDGEDYCLFVKIIEETRVGETWIKNNTTTYRSDDEIIKKILKTKEIRDSDLQNSKHYKLLKQEYKKTKASPSRTVYYGIVVQNLYLFISLLIATEILIVMLALLLKFFLKIKFFS